MPGFFEFVRGQRVKLPVVPTVETCKGKTYIVTGANSGLGFECAKHFVQLSAARVILGVRTLSKGETAKSQIEADTGRKGVVEVWQIDLGSYDSVQAFAKKVNGLDRVDAIIENASVALDQYSTAEGLETQLTVNVIGTFLLAVLVLPKLRSTAKEFNILPHLEVVTSELAFDGSQGLEKIDGDVFDTLTKDRNMNQRYPLTKLLQVFAIRQLAALNPISESGLVMNTVNPGLCTTELTQHLGFVLRNIIGLMRLLLARTAEEGSRTLLHGAVAGTQSHGTYLSECKVKEDTVPDWVTNDSGRKVQEHIWKDLTGRLETIHPGCVSNCMAKLS